MRAKTAKTSAVTIAYEESGPKNGRPVILLHGWPDDVRTWDGVVPALCEAGYRTIVPYIRGYGLSRFRDPLIGRKQRRTGQPVAFAQDTLELAERLGLKRFHFVGHDWGARTGYALAALSPEMLISLAAISVPFEPGKAKPPALPQARAFWYQWLLCSRPGEKMFREDPIAFGKAQWDTWSPPNWYNAKQLEETSLSWKGKDFQEVVLHSYRSRWGHAPLDSRYTRQQTTFEAAKTLSVPTLLLHGKEDHCELQEITNGAERYFPGYYRRILIENVGHFPQREAPEMVARALLNHLQAFQ